MRPVSGFLGIVLAVVFAPATRPITHLHFPDKGNHCQRYPDMYASPLHRMSAEPAMYTPEILALPA